MRFRSHSIQWKQTQLLLASADTRYNMVASKTAMLFPMSLDVRSCRNCYYWTDRRRRHIPILWNDISITYTTRATITSNFADRHVVSVVGRRQKQLNLLPLNRVTPKTYKQHLVLLFYLLYSMTYNCFWFCRPPYCFRCRTTSEVVELASVDSSDWVNVYVAFGTIFYQLYERSCNYFRFGWPPCYLGCRTLSKFLSSNRVTPKTHT